MVMVDVRMLGLAVSMAVLKMFGQPFYSRSDPESLIKAAGKSGLIMKYIGHSYFLIATTIPYFWSDYNGYFSRVK
jgi:hypothetical protein